MGKKENGEELLKNPHHLATLPSSPFLPLKNEIGFILLACGTYGHGQLQNIMRKCIEETWKDIQLK